MHFLKPHYDTEGPFGLPMKDAQAQALEAIIKTLPQPSEPKFIVSEKAPTELLPGERADVSWISTEDVDRDMEIVIAKGMDDSHFKLNPIVTLQHCYSLPPVGKSVWRKRYKDGNMVGIKAKTQYPKRPDSWKDADWPPDTTFTLIQSGLLLGKSIGFLPTKAHAPTDDEITALLATRHSSLTTTPVRRIIDEWLLLEYACVYLPCQQNAVVEAVSKGVKIPDRIVDLFGIPKDLLAPIPFTAWTEIEDAIARKVAAFDFTSLAQKAIADGIDRAKGRI